MPEHRVLFVCMGNICRSPSAEAVMRRLVEERGLSDRLEVDSAGTIAAHAGEAADPRARAAAGRRGYRMTGCARPVTPRDLREFDLIVAMDRDNLADLRDLDPTGASHDRIRLLSDFLPPGSPRDVPDPYYGGPGGFDRVLDMLEAAMPAVLDALLEAQR